MSEVTFNEFAQSLSRIGTEISASESHGILCGLLCLSKEIDARQQWLSTLVNDAYSDQNPTIARFNEIADLLFEDTVKQLNHDSFEFHLLLPGSEQELGLRTEALAHWCQGFSYGLGIGGYRATAQHAGDVVELLRDFGEISRAGYNRELIEEDEEAAYAEIEEYIRVGVMLIMEELNPLTSKKPFIH